MGLISSYGLALLSFTCAFVAGGIWTDAKHPRKLILFSAILMLVFSLFGAYKSGQESGCVELPKDNSVDRLDTDEIYEVTSSLEIEHGSFLVLIKDRHDKVRAYKLDQVPPKVFKKTDDKAKPFLPYPKS